MSMVLCRRALALALAVWLASVTVVAIPRAAATSGQGVAVVSIDKGDFPDPVPAGTDLLYIIRVSVDETSDASNVSLSDPLPAGTTFVSLASPAGWAPTTPAVGTNGLVLAIKGTVPALSINTFDLIVHVNAATPAGTVLSNTATVTWLPIIGSVRVQGVISVPTASATATTTVVAAVPTVTTWVLLTMAGLLPGYAVWLLRRRQTPTSGAS